jgi:hypothetical protein
MRLVFKVILPLGTILGWILLLSSCGTGGGNPGASGGDGDGDGELAGDTLFYDGFEEGLGNWVVDAYWTQWGLNAYTGVYSLHAWDGNSIGSIAEINVAFDLSDDSTAELRFWSKTAYGNMGAGGANTYVLVQVDDGITETAWQAPLEVNQDWIEISVSLDPYCGVAHQLEIAFYYDKLSFGVIRWWLDDVILVINQTS